MTDEADPEARLEAEARLVNLMSLQGRDRYLADLDPSHRAALEGVDVALLTDYEPNPNPNPYPKWKASMWRF